jgi:gluconolactonase
MRWLEEDGHVSVFRANSNFSNGNTRDREGRLVTCEHGNRRVTRTEPNGTLTVLADSVGGKRLNSPNDVVVHSDGSVWFTDPPYGILTDYEGHKAESEIGGCHVYRVDPRTKEVTRVAEDFVKPNGLAFSADEKQLFIADSGRSHSPDAPHHIRVFDVTADGHLQNGHVFAEIDPGVPDGFRVDEDGNLWVGAGDGVHCFDCNGTLIGKILTPETVANVTFGGARRNRLFIAATSTLFAVYLNTRGVQTP